MTLQKLNSLLARHRTTIPVLLLALLTFFLYAGSLNNHFISEHFMNFSTFAGDSLFQNILDNFSKPHLNSSFINYYRPVTQTLYAFVYHLGKLNPVGYHLTGLIFHIAGVVLIYLITNCLTEHKSSSLGFWAAFFFALYPLHPNTVVFAHSTAFSNTFLLFSLYYFLRHASTQKLGDGVRQSAGPCARRPARRNLYRSFCLIFQVGISRILRAADNTGENARMRKELKVGLFCYAAPAFSDVDFGLGRMFEAFARTASTPENILSFHKLDQARSRLETYF